MRFKEEEEVATKVAVFAVITLANERIVGRALIQFSCLFAKPIEEQHCVDYAYLLCWLLFTVK